MAFTSITAIAGEPAPALVYTPQEGEELDEEALANIAEFLGALSPQIGDISIEQANVTVTVPDTYYFLNSKDARAILEDAWGNPPDEDVLGMIFPSGTSPLDGAWGATISYLNDGYVSDEDAAKINYDKILKDLQASTSASNEWRRENGYEEVTLVGWAEQPTYNPETNKLYWAKELTFGDSETRTLNYDIRVLGRRGTLVIGFVATMENLEDIRLAAPSVLEMASFNAGATYAEYQQGVDKKAAYGIAGLVAGAALAKKTGILAAILIFGKKFFVLIIAGLAAAGSAIRKMLSRNNA